VENKNSGGYSQYDGKYLYYAHNMFLVKEEIGCDE
jgi:hypothetical protein